MIARSNVDKDCILANILSFAHANHFEEEHSHQVTKMVLMFFDELRILHKLGERERMLLHAGSLLHDIGRTNGGGKHHKIACDRIMKSRDLLLTKKDKTIVALIARYHRRACPRKNHRYYADLGATSQAVVKKLAALLRVVDGLDRTHTSAVKSVTCRILPKRVIVTAHAKNASPFDQEAGKMKADLFEDVFNREVIIDWQLD